MANKNNNDLSSEILNQLNRIADALERNAPPSDASCDLTSCDAFVWQADKAWLQPIKKVNRIDLKLLQGIDHVRDILLQNTQRFSEGLPANNALLWGARGMGKSSLVKAAHAAINENITGKAASPVKLIEIHREDIDSLPVLMNILRAYEGRVIIFCDDLSFDQEDTSYKSLKAVLEGGIEGRPQNVIFYATSNRRHLMPRDMVENERSTAINPSEATHEKVSLSDRFGLWIGFHNCSQEDYLAMVEAYAKHYGLTGDGNIDLKARALEWAATRGSRSGRVAWQFIQDLAGELGIRISD